MKIIHHLGQYLTRATLVAAVASLAFLPTRALAQEKGAEHLMKLQRLNTVADVQKVEAGDMVVMSCPKCKDTWVTVVENTGKAANPRETKAVQRHACPGCQTKLVTEGAGKQAKSVVRHVCTQCGSTDAFCCVLKKGSGPTQGMAAPKARQP
jgi:hypothetical protein